MAIIKIKRGTQAQIITGPLNLGEMALSTDSKHIFIGDGTSSVLAGRTGIDLFANRPSAGISGRLFYASDNTNLYIDNGTSWVQPTVAASPAGVDTNVQYNSAGAFAGDANFTYDSVTTTLSVAGTLAVPGDVTASREFYIGKYVTDTTNNPGFSVQAYTDGNVYVNFKTTSTGNQVIFRSGTGAVAGYVDDFLRYRTDDKVFLFGTGNTVSKGSTFIIQVKKANSDNFIAIDTTSTAYKSGIKLMSANVQRWLMYVPAGTSNLQFYNYAGSLKMYLNYWGALGLGGVTPTASLHVQYVGGGTTYQQFDSESGSYNVTTFARAGVAKYQIGRTNLDYLYLYNNVLAGYQWWCNTARLNTHFGNARTGVGYISTEHTFGFFEQATDSAIFTGWGQIYAKTDHHLYFRGGNSSVMRLSGFFSEITKFHPDDVSPAINVTVGELSAISFSGTSNNITHVEFVTDERVNTADGDIKFEIMYAMSSSEVGKSVSLNAEVWVFSDTSDPFKVADVTALEDELATPSDGSIKTVALTNIKVPLANVTAIGQRIKLKLWRDIAGVVSNHTGNFQLISMRAYQ